MDIDNIYIGDQKLIINTEPVSGEYTEINGERFYKISNYDKMIPFFMSIVSSSDHWMFVSSNGGLTAGRKNPDNALFPYYTDDVIHTSHEVTGSKTIVHITLNGHKHIWEPFSEYQKNVYNIKRNIYKNIPGNKLVFEEENTNLSLSFFYTWMNSEKYGFVKKSEIVNSNDQEVKINILDGIQNILPYGVYQQFQNEFSTLADGYKKNELVKENGIGIYSLSSIPSDKAEPSESLKATIVWNSGLNVEKYLLCSRQLDGFRSGKDIVNESDIRAARGAYLINSNFLLTAKGAKEWLIISDINQDLTQIAKIEMLLNSNCDLNGTIENDVEEGTRKLLKIVGSSDGLQLGNNKLGMARHFSNVLFNTMRGGIFDDSYSIDKGDFISFLNSTNKSVLKKHEQFLNNLNEKISYFDLKNIIEKRNDSELIKLSLEYLPLTFSRRHGDPSRPWNKFSIDIKNDKNEKVLNYQGNWRDLFQNWEALAHSFPEYIEAMITKFLNASTADGYNPYKVTRDGFDWEAPEPDMPWANIGYWGDHQIIYLLKLLELSNIYDPSILKARISDNIYSYANVPYRIEKYSKLLADARNTINFDQELHNQIIENKRENGSDARFLKNGNGAIYQVNLAEKLLVTLLSKLTNFIPGAGIWMNTQRPEWNDANNALVGNGVSMVTLYYMRRYVSFSIELFSNLEEKSISFSEEVAVLLQEIDEIFNSNKMFLEGIISDKIRKQILDGLGYAGEEYRTKIYKNGFSSVVTEIFTKYIIEFLFTVQTYIDNTISQNKREDELYHSYNLVSIEKEKIKISNLYEMLEGQVGVLSSGYLSIGESIKILEALKESKLYREDQSSYILYPDKQLPHFINKNTVSPSQISSSLLLQKLIESCNEEIVLKDIKGNYHFNGEIRNAKVLKSKLDNFVDHDIVLLVKSEGAKILELYEDHFNHKAFTGRSGTFYKYEGLGSIYWHMVSKLVLAVQETYFRAFRNSSAESDLRKLTEFYYEIKEGIGLNKSPEDYGAFPTDPYSHTPCFSGVQQPGMTGQVKEDIISRYGELGIQVNDRIISINPSLLDKNEFLLSGETYNYFNSKGKEQTIQLKKGSLAFTYCQVPFIYSLSKSSKINVVKSNGENIKNKNLELNKEISSSIFKRLHEIDRVEVSLLIN